MTRGSTTMKRLILFLTLALAIPLAQAQQILSLSAIAPAPVQNLQGQNGGADVAPGSGTACYYVVANYIGGAIRSTALQITTLPTSLSSTNYIQLGWSPVVGFGVTYDVLKSANCAAIAPGASVSLETGQSTTTYQDQGGGLSAYTQSGFMFQNATGLLRLNNWDYTIPQIEIKVAPPGSPFLSTGPLSDGNLAIQAHGSAANIGIELLGKGTGGLYWDGTELADSTGAQPGLVYSVEATPTLSQVNAGFVLVAANSARTLKVTHVLLTANGGNTAACTGVLIEDTNGTPVVALTALTAALTEATPVDETITNVTPGAGFAPATLTAAKGIQIIKDGGTACTTATSYSVIVFYKQNS